MTGTARQSLLEHLEELRSRLVKIAVAITAGAIVAFILRNAIFDLLVQPWEDVAGDRNLAFFRPTEGFSLFMRLSLFGGLVLASPVVLWQIWAFVAPGLTRREKRNIVPAVVVLALLFFAGLAFGYWSLERGLEFLLEFGEDRLDPTIGGQFYFSFAMRFLLVFALAFEFPVFLFALAMTGVVTTKQLRAGRRWAIMIIVVVGAVVTPSGDPLTLTLLSVPLYLLYELTLFVVWLLKRRS